MSNLPSYLSVFATFARNSLVRDMTFRSNFIIETIASLSWMAMNLGFYILIFSHTDSLGAASGWGKYPFFVFFATTALINSLVHAFFMPNIQEFSELIRTGNLDFALLKPIDTQFLISLHRMEWSSFGNSLFAIGLLVFSVGHLDVRAPASVMEIVPYVLYPIYIVCGVAILYSLMIALASTSIWLGRNRSLYDFWFYITNFTRYPMEIYSGPEGSPRRLVGHAIQGVFTFVIPVLVAVNVPARLLAKPLDADQWPLALYALFATVASLLASHWVFQKALLSYRSASS